MTKKKLSGQTITIIILAILLLLTCVFGGVYAYYSTTSAKISGKITMANLKISLNKEQKGNSLLLKTNGLCLPNTSLENETPLTVTNESNTSIYLAIVYTVEAKKIETDELVIDNNLDIPLLDIDVNGWHNIWYTGNFKGTNKSEQEVSFRYWMMRTPVAPAKTEEEKKIEVIPKEKLKLHPDMGNLYQSTNISFSFRAYAIGSASLDSPIAKLGENPTDKEKYNLIMSAIFKAFDFNMFD